MIRDMWNDGWVGRLILGGIALLPAFLIVAVWGLVLEQREWERFKDAHNCRVVGKTFPTTTITIAPIIGRDPSVAVGVSTTSGKTGWLCDDGVTYWR